jgi:hypothetical protein
VTRERVEEETTKTKMPQKGKICLFKITACPY